MAFRPGKNNKNILSRIGRKSEGKMGVSDGVWECGKPKRFSIISMPQSEGPKAPLLAGRYVNGSAAAVVAPAVVVAATVAAARIYHI